MILNKIRNDVDYYTYHKKRFDMILHMIDKEMTFVGEISILNIGVTGFDIVLFEKYRNLTTLDLHERYPEIEDKLNGKKHIVVNLNKLYDRDRWPIITDKFDVILFCEVIEHLTSAPEYVMDFLHGLLADNGTLILQTPNAVSITNRIKMMAGRNPFDRIRHSSSVTSHGHIHEYTKKELYDICKETNFSVTLYKCKNYFNKPKTWKFPINLLYKVYLSLTGLIPSFRDGHTLLLRRSTFQRRL